MEGGSREGERKEGGGERRRVKIEEGERKANTSIRVKKNLDVHRLPKSRNSSTKKRSLRGEREVWTARGKRKRRSLSGNQIVTASGAASPKQTEGKR